MAEDLPPAVTLRRMTTAYWTSQVIHETAKLGIPDLLADGPKTAEALASATATHAPSLYRLLRALASLGILLRTDADGSVRAWSIMVGEPWFRAAWDNLMRSLMTGKPAFPDVHGMGFWEYLGRHEDAAALFDAAMTSVAPIKAGAAVAAYDFSPFATVVDLGGGHGTLLATILTAHPTARGILFDLPHVIAGADTATRSSHSTALRRGLRQLISRHRSLLIP
jgi:hypothetical protein